jgi:DNA-binding GntR family transcriptional regulator
MPRRNEPIEVISERHAGTLPARSGAARNDNKRKLLSGEIAEELRRGILSGRFKAGQRLVEDRLSAEFGVSRVPVREAIKMLVAEGLAEPSGRRGVQVVEITRELALELVEVRATLEGLNAKLAARHRDPEIIAHIRAVLERGNAAAEDGSAGELAQLNSEFHELLATAGSNRVLQDVIRTLRERTNLVFQLNTTERAREDWREHAQILAAVAEGDEELAMLQASRHVHRAAQSRLAELETRMPRLRPERKQAE